MILLCNCINSTADARYGKGKRPHVKLEKTGPIQEYLCEFCYYVRTKAQGRQTGEKTYEYKRSTRRKE